MGDRQRPEARGKKHGMPYGKGLRKKARLLEVTQAGETTISGRPAGRSRNARRPLLSQGESAVPTGRAMCNRITARMVEILDEAIGAVRDEELTRRTRSAPKDPFRTRCVSADGEWRKKR
jgi:hypothetical protein